MLVPVHLGFWAEVCLRVPDLQNERLLLVEKLDLGVNGSAEHKTLRIALLGHIINLPETILERASR